MTPRLDALTDREEQVLRMIAGGLGMREVAASLKISEQTAKWHRRTILHKLGARTQAHAVALYAGLEAKA